MLDGRVASGKARLRHNHVEPIRIRSLISASINPYFCCFTGDMWQSE